MKKILSLLIVSIGLCFVSGVAMGSHGHYHQDGIENHMSLHIGVPVEFCYNPGTSF